MATNPNMVAIQTVTVSATSAANIEFTNIPQDYTDLVIKLSGRTDRSDTQDDLAIQINSDGTAGRHSWRILYGNGSVAAVAANTSDTRGHGGWVPSASATASTFSNVEIYIPNYAGSNQKSFSVDGVQENNLSTAYSSLVANLYNQTTAVTSVKLFSRTDVTYKFVQHSTATLYGVTSAGVGSKATGGIISETDTHWIHTFTASGTFTPTVNLTADYLVIAGGAGGGRGGGGGGGAGGLRSTVTATGGGGSLESALSLTAQAYTVTVGAGGAGTTTGGDTAPAGSSGSNSIFSTITSTGGGGGGSINTSDGSLCVGVAGGSGGGAGFSNGRAGGSGTTNQGRAGGTSGTGNGGGGGGSDTAGANGGGVGTSGGNGGAGVAVSITGSSVNYAGGGGGGGNFTGGSTAGSGGTGGGGNGEASGVNGAVASAGTANTGGGGGGGGVRDGGIRGNGGAGGSGIVIIRYAK